jgi:cystathionine beta-synthase
VPDRDAFLTARATMSTEGLLVGESGGTALWAALQVARDVDDADALFVVLLPDSGRNYLAKLYNDGWLREVGLIGPEEAVSDYDWSATRPEVVVRREV